MPNKAIKGTFVWQKDERQKSFNDAINTELSVMSLRCAILKSLKTFFSRRKTFGNKTKFQNVKQQNSIFILLIFHFIF